MCLSNRNQTSSSISFDLVGVYLKMASSSSGGRMMMPSSSFGGDRKYDVFLSFRGEDTRKTFVGHLYRALQQSIINAYIDSEDLDKGKRISELLIAIEDSKFSIVVLSQNYASSKWCLRELAKIMECMDKKQQIVVPIFYHVDPSDVRNVNGTFAQAFAKHEANSQLAKEEVECWRLALTRVADLSGWDSRKYEDDGELIKDVVGDTLSKWIHTSSNKANKGLVGMDSHITVMNAKLCLEVNDVRVVGIWGMGGLGKTTIAKAVYGEIACEFEHSCFVDNVKKKREAEVQEELLLRLLKQKEQGIDLHRGRDMIMERLGTRKVLVVLDDVENFSQIKELLGEPHAFGKGSRIIATTRDKQSPKEVDETYHPECLNQEKSRELLVKHAFGTDPPSEEYNDLINQAIEYAQRLPLALKVLGASLYDKEIHQWKDLLAKIKIMPDKKIMDVLRISYEGLDFLEQQIFLDIACIFRGREQDFVTEILHDSHPDIGLTNLVNRSLITISESGILDMHDLLQELGREIVRRESLKEPGQRSRLWSFKDVDQVLTQNTATDVNHVIECLVLDLPKEYCLNVGAFVGMTKLRVLIIYDYYFDGQATRGELEFRSHELRLLEWEGCPLKSLPNTFIPKNLVILDMSGSDIQQLWEGTKPLQNLKEIRLSYCESLIKIPDLTKAIHLKNLELNGCSSLLELHSSISALQELKYLTLAHCKQLENLPSSIHMKSLETLNLSWCLNLEKFPEISDVMSELQKLYLRRTAIKKLPESINNLTGLGVLDLSYCAELTTLSSSIHLSSLRQLNLSGCSKLEKFPEISGIMEELPELCLDGTAIDGLPSSIDQLKGIKNLSMRNCKSLEFLPDSICNLAQLTGLDLSGCSKLKTLSSLPDTIWNLAELRYLNLSGCTQLRTLSSSIHLSSLRQLDLSGCSNLEKFPEILGIMEELSELILDGTAIKGLPSSIDQLQGVKKLNMPNCKGLEFLPDSISSLAALTHIDMSGCSLFHNLPEELGVLQSLEVLDLSYSGIQRIPFSVLRLVDNLLCVGCEEMTELLSAWPSSVDEYRSYSVLQHLDLSDCNLLELSDRIAHLSSLKTLKLCRNNLESLPVTMNRLGCLTHLDLEGCKRLKSIPELSTSSIHIYANCCTALQTVSRQKTRNFDFMFSNCFRLQANLFTDIVEAHSLHQDNHLRPLLFNMRLPGIEVPEWFNFRDTGCSLSFLIPLNSFNSKLLGFAICIAINFNGAQLDVSNMYGRCHWSWTSRGNHAGERIVKFDVLSRQFRTNRFLESGHLFMAYLPWTGYGWIADGLDAFKIVVETGTLFVTEDCFTSSCGVRLVYSNHEEMNNGVTLPKEEEVGKACQILKSAFSLREREIQREGDRVTGVFQNGEILELCSHSGLVVPNSQGEGKQEKDVMSEETLAGRGLFGPLCSCFYWLGEIWRGR